MDTTTAGPTRPALSRVAEVLAWLSVAAVAAALAAQRFVAVVSDPSSGHDLAIYLRAARAFAAGGSPYDEPLYVYSPLLAVVAAPLGRLSDPDALAVWTAASLLAALVAVGTVLASVWTLLGRWSRPALAGVAAVTLLYNVPTSIELWFGQTDLFVFALVALAGIAGARGVAAGLIGVAGALKTWPLGVGLWLVRRGSRSRARNVVVAVVTAGVLTATPILVVGPATLGQWARRTLTMSEQPLAAYSAWGVGRHLFTDSGVMEPLAESPTAHALVTGALLAWVAFLLVVVLRRPGHPALALWNTVACVLLLLPVSHEWYLPLTLPILWVWLALGARRRRWTWYLVVAVLAVSWVAEYRVWPGDPRATDLRAYVTIMAAAVLAVSVSVLAAARRGRRAPLPDLPPAAALEREAAPDDLAEPRRAPGLVP